MAVEDLKDLLEKYFNMICRESPYADLFFVCLRTELAALFADDLEIPRKTGESGGSHLVFYNFLRIKGINILPLSIDHSKEVYARYIPKELFHSDCPFEDRLNGCQSLLNHLKKKEFSWIKRKILSLTNEIKLNLIKISEENDIPIQSVIQICRIMTLDPESLHHQYDYVAISSDIPQSQRDEYLLGINKNIYDLIVESIWVLSVVGIVDLLNVYAFYIHVDLEDVKAYMLESAAYPELESKIADIKNEDELFECVFEGYYPFPGLVKSIEKYLHRNIKYRARRQSYLINLPLKVRLDPALSLASKDDDSIPVPDAIINAFPVMKSAKSSPSAIDNLHQDMFINFVNKFVNGLLDTYKLQGKPESVLRYIKTIFYNIGHSATSEYYEILTKNKFHISTRTKRRYKKDYENGTIKQEDLLLPTYREIKFSDLAPEHIDMIKEAKIQNKTHRKEGWLTQRQLIKILRDKYFADQYKSCTGMNFKIMSEPTLRNKLDKLIKCDKVPVIKTKDAYYFVADKESIISIASELLKLK